MPIYVYNPRAHEGLVVRPTRRHPSQPPHTHVPKRSLAPQHASRPAKHAFAVLHYIIACIVRRAAETKSLGSRTPTAPRLTRHHSAQALKPIGRLEALGDGIWKTHLVL